MPSRVTPLWLAEARLMVGIPDEEEGVAVGVSVVRGVLLRLRYWWEVLAEPNPCTLKLCAMMPFLAENNHSR